ncbi:MAG: T9SS type A sorting domain-containing protein [Bacteroidetes bacterium]|nr:T9SS type A sorting domain-containing protein [Bacteroidota bacterium]
MRRGVSAVLLLLLACSMHAQVVVDSLEAPFVIRALHVAAEDELYMLPLENDTLCHSTDGGRSWTIAQIPRMWERHLPAYDLFAMPGGTAVLTFGEWNAAKDTQSLGVLITKDAGQTWTVRRMPAKEILPNGATKLIFSTDSTLYTAAAGRYFRSDDLGGSWVEVPELAGMQQLRFTGGGQGWAFSSSDTLSIVARSTDRGETWKYDTLRLRITGFGAGYDGTVLANIYDTIPPQSFLFFDDADETWTEVTYPFIQDFNDRSMQWQRMLAFPGGRFIAFSYVEVHPEYELVSALFSSEDRGGHWSRIPYYRDAPSMTWKPVDQSMTDVWRIGPSDFLAQEKRGSTIAAVRLPNPVSMIATAEDFSTTRHLQTLLRWSDPFDGKVNQVEIERSSADSSWMRIAQGPALGQQYLDSTIQGARTVRYRVTLSAEGGGTATAVTDSITPFTGKYFDQVDYLLPAADRLLRYRVREITGVYSQHLDTAYGTADVRFLPPADSTALIRVHPVELVRQMEGKAADTTRGRILEYRSIYHYWRDEGVYPGLDFQMQEPNVTSGPEHPGMTRRKEHMWEGWMLPDSCAIFTIGPSTGMVMYWESYFILGYGVGIRYLNYQFETSFTHSFDAREWTLIEHVNSTDAPPLPASTPTLSSYPNPLTDGATVRYDIPVAGEVALTVHDLLGRRVAQLAEGWRSAGSHHAFLRPASLAPGTYLLRLIAAGTQTTRLIALIR